MTLSSVPVHTPSQHSQFLRHLLPLADTHISFLGPKAKPHRANWSLWGYTASFFTVPQLISQFCSRMGGAVLTDGLQELM